MSGLPVPQDGLADHERALVDRIRFGERDDAEGLFSGHEARVVAVVESGAARGSGALGSQCQHGDGLSEALPRESPLPTFHRLSQSGVAELFFTLS